MGCICLDRCELWYALVEEIYCGADDECKFSALNVTQKFPNFVLEPLNNHKRRRITGIYTYILIRQASWIKPKKRRKERKYIQMLKFNTRKRKRNSAYLHIFCSFLFCFFFQQISTVCLVSRDNNAFYEWDKNECRKTNKCDLWLICCLTKWNSSFSVCVCVCAFFRSSENLCVRFVFIDVK